MNRSRFARIALLLSAALPVYFIVAALGTKFGWWDWRTGLLTLIVGGGPALLALALLVALVALAVTLWRRPRDGWRTAAVAALIPLLGFGYLGYVRSESAALPPIHDIATDPADPPTLSPELQATRARPGANPIADLTAPLSANEMYRDPRFAAVAGRSIAELSRESYPDVAPLRVDRAPDAAFDAAQAALTTAGFEVTTADAASGRIEAVAESFWFGFEDDVIVRVRPDGDGSRIDLRSISRVGVSDLGANAKRVRALLADIRKRLA
jgi:uncharacterized protein (DUF1499 family)